MTDSPQPIQVAAARAPGKRNLVAVAVLAVVAWIAHFWFMPDLGLHEDDYSFVGLPLTWSVGDWIAFVESSFSGWRQGRPIGNAGSRTIAFLAFNAGGIAGVYLAAYLIIALNTWLFYELLRRLTYPSLAFLGALWFCLWPADLTKTLLTHALELHLAMSFLLLASHCYVRGGKAAWTSYVFAAAALLTYESAFLPFILLPLLRSGWGRRWARAAIGHVLLCGILFGAAAALRIYVFEEARALGASQSLTSLLGMSASAMLHGPLVSLGAFVWRPLSTLREITPPIAVAIVLCGSALAPAIHRYANLPAEATARRTLRWRGPGWRVLAVMPGVPAEALRLVLCGAALAAAAYALTILPEHFPPIQQRGRLTSTHFAAAFGGSMVAAGLMGLLLGLWPSRVGRSLSSLIMSLYVAILIGCGLLVQADFVRSWQIQRAFWSDVVRLSPDVTDQTLIFIPASSISQTKHILAHSWSTPLVLHLMYRFPKTWTREPRVFVVSDAWRARVRKHQGRYYWLMPGAWWPRRWTPLEPRNLVYLESRGGELTRRDGLLPMPGGSLALKPRANDLLAQTPRTPLADLLLGCDEYRGWNLLLAGPPPEARECP